MRLVVKIEGKYFLFENVKVDRPGDGRVYLTGNSVVSAQRRKSRRLTISMTYDIAELLNADAKNNRP